MVALYCEYQCLNALKTTRFFMFKYIYNNILCIFIICNLVFEVGKNRIKRVYLHICKSCFCRHFLFRRFQKRNSFKKTNLDNYRDTLVVSGGLRGVPTDIAAPGCHSRRVGSDIACESCDPGLSFQPHLNYKPPNGGVWDPKIN